MSSYSPPEWSAAPEHKFTFDVLRHGSELAPEDLSTKCFYLFGRQADVCDIVLDHPSASRQHCVLQHKTGGEVFLFDLNSTHGTFVNKQRIAAKTFTPLNIGDSVRFGESSRLYILNGPEELRPAEVSRAAPIKIDKSQLRSIAAQSAAAKQPLFESEVSWGLAPDDEAVEESDVDLNNDFKAWLEYARAGTLEGISAGHIDNVAKLVAKVEKCERKIDNLQREMNNLQAKDGDADRKQQVSTLLYQYRQELANLEDDVREAIAAAQGKNDAAGPVQKKRSYGDDDDEDDFYDRTVSKKASNTPAASSAVENADSLLTKIKMCQRRIESINAAVQRAQAQVERLKAQADDDEYAAYMVKVDIDQQMQEINKQQKALIAEQTEEKRLQSLIKLIAPSAALPVAAKIEPAAQPERSHTVQSNAASTSNVEHDSEPAKSESKPIASTFAAPQVKPKILVPAIGPLLPPTKVPTGTIKLQLDTEHVETSHNEDNPDSIQLEDSETSRTTSAVFAKPVARSLEDVVAQYKQTSQNTSRITPGLVPGGLVHSKKKKLPEVSAGQSGPADSKKRKVEGTDDDGSSWVAPTGQRGDGKTHLNAKFGY